MTVPRLLAVDPGRTVGVCTWDDEGNITKQEQIFCDEFPYWLENLEPRPEVIVCEDFRLFKKKAVQQSGSKMEASKTIGHVESFSFRHHIKLVMQDSSILGVAVKLTQMPLPSDHSKSHWVSAYNHGMYWLIKNNYREVAMD